MTDADLYKIDQIHPHSVHYDTCIKEAKECAVLYTGMVFEHMSLYTPKHNLLYMERFLPRYDNCL